MNETKPSILVVDDDVDTCRNLSDILLDLGYRFDFEGGAFAEPQASLAVVNTQTDDIDNIFGGSVKFDDETSVRGRLGLRLGYDYEGSDGIIYTPDVTASV